MRSPLVCLIVGVAAFVVAAHGTGKVADALRGASQRLWIGGEPCRYNVIPTPRIIYRLRSFVPFRSSVPSLLQPTHLFPDRTRANARVAWYN